MRSRVRLSRSIKCKSKSIESKTNLFLSHDDLLTFYNTTNISYAYFGQHYNIYIYIYVFIIYINLNKYIYIINTCVNTKIIKSCLLVMFNLNEHNKYTTININVRIYIYIKTPWVTYSGWSMLQRCLATCCSLVFVLT